MPCRGLILAHNRRGQRFREKEVHRWLAYSVRVLNCAKVDILAWGDIPQSILTTIHYAREFAVPVSLRTDCTASPEILRHLAAEGLADVFLCPRAIDDDSLFNWLETCGQIGIPVRVQLQLPVLGNRSSGNSRKMGRMRRVFGQSCYGGSLPDWADLCNASGRARRCRIL